MLSFFTGNYTDLYQLTMGEVCFLEGRAATPVCFDYFFRKVPNHGGYVVFAGLEDALEVLENLRFTEKDIAYLQQLNFHPSFIEHLKSFRFTGTIHAVREGEIVFPYCPILRVEGTQLEAQLIETVLLNLLNFESLIATKASRMRYVAGSRLLSDFGLRRAHGPAGLLASRAAIIGGFNSTSNVYAGEAYGVEVAGTMAHSFIESYASELEAFRAFAKHRPDGCIFLVDTYDTLRSGVPNAITVAKEIERTGKKALGVRLDSGDLAWLSRETRRMLDEAGLPYMKIVASNQLDEFVIKSLLEQQAPIDVFGVGTRLVTGQPDAALDGVYKLCMADHVPRLKISESIQKVTLPGIKQVMRILDSRGQFWGADAISLLGEQPAGIIYHPFEPGKSLVIDGLRQEALLHPVIQAGKRTTAPLSLTAIAAYVKERLAQLPPEYKRFENPHKYKVSLSRELFDLRQQLVSQYKLQENESAYSR